MNPRQSIVESNGVAAERPAVAQPDLWHALRRRKGRIVLALLLGIAGAVLFCAAAGPWYDSSAQLLVIKKRFDTAPITAADQGRASEDYLSTHMLLIASHKVVTRAIEKGNLQDLDQYRNHRDVKQLVNEWVGPIFAENEQGRPEDRLAREIIDSLVISRDAAKPGLSPSNEILNLSIRGPVAADCPRVLDAIIASYQEFLQETFRNTNAETLELIAQARGMVQKDLETKEAAYQKFLATTPPLWKGQDGSSAQKDHLFKIDAKRTALRVRRTEIDAAIAMLDRAVKEGRNPSAVVERLTAFPTTGGFGPASPLTPPEPALPEPVGKVSLEDQLNALLVQKAKLATIRGPRHSDMLALDRQIDAIRGMISPTATKDTNIGTLKIELLKQERDDLAVAELALAKLFEAEQQGASASYIHEKQDEAHRLGIQHDRQLLDTILSRLKEISSVKDFGGYNTQVIGPALQGRRAVRKYLLVFGLAAFAGLFVGLGWAYLAEIRGRKA
jgi:uncharacterized protein involved in exopolysaccharide biosynthesis